MSTGLADSQYHVKLNGSGFLLVDESYRKKGQQSFSPRFATGDPSVGDLSYWQFLTQKGWTGEGQEKFDVVTKYRQSAGWDLRDGKPRLAKGAETLTLANALPAQVGLVAAGTAVLFEDFLDPASPSLSKWESGYYKNVDPYSIVSTNQTVGGAQRGRSGWTNTDGSGYPCWLPAFGLYGGGSEKVLPPVHISSDLASVGEWRFTLYTESSAVNKVHCRFVPLHDNSTGGYVLEISGSDMTVAKLYHTVRSTPILAVQLNDLDVLVTTFTGPTAKSNTATVFKLTRSIAGLWELFQDGVSLGTVTDTTYQTPGGISWATSLHATSVNTSDAATWISDIYLPSKTTADIGDGSKFVLYNNKLHTCWYTAAAAFTFTDLVTGSQASNIPGITHLNARDIAVWSRDGEPTANKNTFLATCRGQIFRCYNTTTQVFTVATTIYGTCVYPINSTTIVVVGTTTENSGVPAFEVIKFTAETWTVATQTVNILDGGVSGRAVPSACLDSNGALYIGISDLTSQAGALPSRLFVISSADLLATKPTVTAAYTLNDFVLRGVFSLAGSVYLHGARIRGTQSFATVLKHPSTVMWESTLGKTISPATDAINFNHGVMCVWKNLDNVLFLGMNDLALWDPILQLDASGNVVEVASFDSGQFDYGMGNILAIAEWNGRMYLINSGAGTVVRNRSDRGTLGSAFATAVLEGSDMGANTDLINKTLRSVTLELSTAVPAGETLSVIVNGTTVGTMVTADGTRKEMSLAAELTASAFICKLSWPQASTWSGYVKNGPLLKYVPTQLKKKAWAIGCRTTKNLRLIDGKTETRSAAVILAALWTAWASNTPVTFIDLDRTSYSVLVTDIDQRVPLVPSDLNDLEALAFVELLEI